MDNKPLVVCNTPLKNVLSFCDRAIVWHSKQRVTQLNPDFSETLICLLEKSASHFSFAQGGVAIFHNHPFS